MATIDKIQVQGTTYDINLPATASPTISSLTITGNLTVNGTANLSVISSTGDCLISAKNITISGSSLSLIHNNNHYLISLPNKPGTIALTNDIPSSPFSRIQKVDSSTPITLASGEKCILYPLATTSRISFKLSSNGSYQSTSVGTVIQNTSYATSIKTGTGLLKGYDVGSYYRCYYGDSTYTYSITSYKNGVGIDTWSTPADLYTSVACLACVLKKSV